MSDQEERLVDELLRITKPLLDKMTRKDRERGLRRLNSYLASLDEKTVTEASDNLFADHGIKNAASKHAAIVAAELRTKRKFMAGEASKRNG